ncbi:MAG TPA: serine/threonine-protein kinase [Acidimicrobiales bacterium]|nr:serine/threonine-protein kinase [Acidimicrobiales bacterium]
MPDTRLAHQLVADRYELLETVGRGGFGVVWRACDTLLERHVAVKEIHIPGFLGEQDRIDLREKVLKEARAAARLDHPGAVTVYDVIDDDGHPVIVMELVEAPTLSQLVAERGPMAPAEVARIGLEILDVLDAAHAHGIVHRDVKPANVMVAPSGRVRLGDFGVAAILDDPTVSTSGAVTGSPAYMAPEQATNKGAIAESDLWSLGATMYFAVEGVPPFDKGAPLPTLASIVQDPPRPMERAGALGPVLEGLLVKSPADRFTAADLRPRLARIAAGEAASPPPRPEPRPDDTAVLDLDETAPATVAAAPPTPPAVAAPPPLRPTPPRPTPAPTSVARPAGGRRNGVIVAVVALVVLGLIGIALAARSGSRSQTATSPSTTTAGGKASATTAAPRGGSSGATTAYTDSQTGFTISFPKGWSVSTNGTLTDFRDPDSGAYLRVDHVQPPGPSPEGAWFQLEPSFAAANANYQRIRIDPTTYSGYRAAVWEYTYSSGGADLHAVDLGFITPRYGFALNFQTKAADWDRLQPVFQAFKDSFKAPS